ncbi:MAG: DUF4340 domain-containing protein, partial [Planctomycetota bacterium]
MHSEYLKSIVLGVVAVLLTLTAYLFAPSPRLADQDFSDQGQPFFPKLTDPDTITDLEVRVYNDSTTQVQNFRVQQKSEGDWIIPSHHNYPADAKEELGKVVNSFMGLSRDRLVGQTTDDQETFGVIDPDDKQTDQVGGRGRKIIFRDSSGNIVAQYIIGNKVENFEGQHYVRVPGEKRIYAVKFEPFLSTKFGDWIDPDLLQVKTDDIQQVVIDPYKLDQSEWPRGLRIVPGDKLTLTRMVDADHPAPGALVLDGLTPNLEMNKSNVESLLDTLAAVRIVGVRSIAEYEQSGEVGLTNYMANQPLANAGFFVDSHNKKVYCDRGQVQIVTKDQIEYTLRFGELAAGAGEALTAGVDPKDSTVADSKTDKGPAPENRYLWVDVKYIGPEAKQGQPEPPAKKKAADLEDRFQTFFYVISADNMAKIERTRDELTEVRSTPAPTTPPGSSSQTPPHGHGLPPVRAHPPGENGGAVPPPAPEKPAQPPVPAPAPAPT